MPENKGLENAIIEWDDSATPRSSRFGDIYFSRDGGIAETRHVFLQGNALEERWRTLSRAGFEGSFHIAELGFGTGLNFLCCWQLWQRLPSPPRGMRLHYVACEKYPLTRAQLKRALDCWPELEPFSTSLLEVYPEHSSGYHRLVLRCPDQGPAEGSNDARETPAPDRKRSGGNRNIVVLDLYYGDALEMLSRQPLSQPGETAPSSPGFDAWFLDGFAPRVNPSLWSDALLAAIVRYSHRGTTLSSYSVSGPVVRGLRSHGFDVEKRPGFGHKRHMLGATYNSLRDSGSDSQRDENDSADNGGPGAERRPEYFHYPPPPMHCRQPSRCRVLVVGAGLAGCSTAWSLARRGYQVEVVESRPEAAMAASGNPRAVLQCRLGRQPTTATQFHLQGFLYSGRHFHQLQTVEGRSLQWQRCGVLRLAANHAQAPAHYAPELLREVDRGEASDIAGIEVATGGLYLPDGGWLNPRALCRAWLNHENITLRTGIRVHSLRQKTEHEAGREAGNWLLLDAGERLISQGDVVVLANSSAATDLEPAAGYPLSLSRGQLTYVPASAVSRNLRTVVCGQSYITPCSGDGSPRSVAVARQDELEGVPGLANNMHCLGASYSQNLSNTALSEDEQAENLAGLKAPFPDLAATFAETARLNGRVAVRAGGVDHLPLIGQLPDREAFMTDYAALSRDASQMPTTLARYHEGLYLNIGHGSHGLASCPLGAELLASMISAEPLPLQQDLLQGLNPARFIIRELKRHKMPE